MMDVHNRTIFEDAFLSDWHMEAGERASFIYLLDRLRPEVSIEIGTFRGGSLRPISHFSKRAYTLDINESLHDQRDEFPNVDFLTGDSSKLLPGIIERLNESRDELGFVLVDGDHSERGVKADIDAVLEYRPKTKPLVIVMHDSANPDVRRGILRANWSENIHVHGVDVDFCRGMLHNRPDIRNQIWGGLGVATLTPQARTDELTITQTFGYALSKLIPLSK